MHRDRLRLAAPWCAQVASFGVVLAIGAFLGHSSPPRASHQPARVQLSVRTRVTQPRGTASPCPHCQATLFPAASPFGARLVVVLDTTTLRRAGLGRLSPWGEQSFLLPRGTYQVCLSAPARWRPAAPQLSGTPGWLCAGVALERPRTVIFPLRHDASPRHAGPAERRR